MANLHAEFYQQLSAELDIARTLHQLLLTERSLLEPPQFTALAKLQEHKKQQLNALKTQSQRRCDWLNQQHIELNSDCIRHPKILSAVAEDNARLEHMWQQLADQIEQNSRLTDVLSHIVLEARLKTQKLIKILRGQKNSSNVYDKRGQAPSKQMATGFAKA